MRASIGFVVAALLLVSGQVMAEESGWYAGAGLGAMKFETKTPNGTAKDSTLGGSLLAGYRVNPYLAWEGELTYSGDATDTVNGIYTKTNFNFISAGIQGRIPFGNVFAVFGRFSALYGKGDYTIGTTDSSARDAGYSIGAGASVTLGAIDVRLRYDVENVRLNDVNIVEDPERFGLDVIWNF